MEDSDSVAVARVRAGDGDAYRVLVDRHSRSVFRLAYRMTGNEQDSEDVVQETFLRAYKQLHRWEARSSFGTWLYRIAANYSLDLMRRRKRHGEVTMNDSGPDDDVLEMAQALPSTEAGPERLLFSNRVQACVTGALNELSQQSARRSYCGTSKDSRLTKSARRWGFSGNAAKHSIFRAVQKLRRALEPLVNTQS